MIGPGEGPSRRGNGRDAVRNTGQRVEFTLDQDHDIMFKLIDRKESGPAVALGPMQHFRGPLPPLFDREPTTDVAIDALGIGDRDGNSIPTALLIHPQTVAIYNLIRQHPLFAQVGRCSEVRAACICSTIDPAMGAGLDCGQGGLDGSCRLEVPELDQFAQANKYSFYSAR